MYFFTLIIFVTVIFVSRNIVRVTNEIEKYSYKPFIETYYRIDESHFRIEKRFDKIYENSQLCVADKKKCDDKLSFHIQNFLNTYIFVKN